MRIVIAGIPRSGKTTTALDRGCYVFHTDNLQHLDWSEASDTASYWFDTEGPWIIEGVMAIRALRKWLKRNPTGVPCEYLIWLPTALVPLSDGQARMAKSCVTMFYEIEYDLRSRGVQIYKTCETLRAGCLLCEIHKANATRRAELRHEAEAVPVA